MNKIEINEVEFTDLMMKGVRDFSGYVMPDVTKFYRNHRSLVSLPDLPKVVYLNCSRNNIKLLPDLPEVTHLICSFNSLISLPIIPKIKYLECHNNSITGSHYTIGPTSGRSVYYFKSLDKLLTGCFNGTLEEFYQRGYIKEGKQWVKDFYELNK